MRGGALTPQLHRDLLVTLAKLDPFISIQEPEVDGKKGAASRPILGCSSARSSQAV